MEWDLIIQNAANAVTHKRPVVTFQRAGDTTNTSTTVAMADTSNIEVGFGVSGAGIPGSTTVSSITPNTSIVISNAATATATGVELTFDAGQQGQINGQTGDIELRAGVVSIKVSALPALGVDTLALGSTREGAGPLEWGSTAADVTIDGATHAGKVTELTKASGTQTITAPSPSNCGVRPGQVVYLMPTGSEALTTWPVAAGTGSPTIIKPGGASANLQYGAMASLTATPGDDWVLGGSAPT
jgi:hypothetical protein